MNKNVNVSLNLNEEIRLLVRKRLREFASQNPENKYNILCWIDDVSKDLVDEIDEFLIEDDCEKRLNIGGRIIGKSRSQYFKYTKKQKI